MVTKKQIARKAAVDYWQDVAERAGRTFLQGYLAAWLLEGADYAHLFTINNAQFGAVACALSLAMSLGAKNVGDKNTASLIPK